MQKRFEEAETAAGSVKRETNKMYLIWSFFQLSMSICFGHHYVHLRENKTVCYRIWCSALVVLVMADASCVRTARFPSPHNHSQYNQCRTPYAVLYSLVLLKMGTLMPETYWDRRLTIKVRLVACCWLLPTFMMYGHKSLKFLFFYGLT